MKVSSPRVPAVLALLLAVAGCGSSSGAATASPGSGTSSGSSSASSSSVSTPAGSSTGTSGDLSAVVSAADAFLGTLSTTEKAAGLFAWTDTTQKTRWSNFPEGLFTRKGLKWGNLGEKSRTAWLALMQATLSKQGYERVRAEWLADDALASGGGPCCYGSENYWVALIGQPSASSPWQWQWGGHHVTVNATVSGGELALYPSFIGAQPASYSGTSGTTVEPLGDIWDAAYAVVSSLSAAQKAKAVLGTSSIDLVYGPGEDDREPVYEGIAGSALSAAQQELLLTLVGKYANLANDTAAAARLAELKSTLGTTYFCWYGPTTDTGTGYFRVVGPKVIIEYSPQAMGGKAADHIHGIYRDPANDYGSAITG